MDYAKLIEIAEKRAIDPKYKDILRRYLERSIASGQSLHTTRNKVFTG